MVFLIAECWSYLAGITPLIICSLTPKKRVERVDIRLLSKKLLSKQQES